MVHLAREGHRSENELSRSVVLPFSTIVHIHVHFTPYIFGHFFLSFLFARTELCVFVCVCVQVSVCPTVPPAKLYSPHINIMIFVRETVSSSRLVLLSTV